MPNSAYTILPGTFGFCPTAVIAAAIPRQAGPTSVTISGLSSSVSNPITVGMGVMVNDEIMAVQTVSGSSLTLRRGCADTIPQAHPANSRIWFFQSSVGRVPTEYAATDSVSVKPLPRTSSAVVPIEGSPPLGVVMNSRFARPYPPGNVQINGQPWFTTGTTVTTANSLVLSWAHRNRVTQADLLVPHTEGSITPEAGQTYRLRVYRAAGDVLIGTYNTSDPSITYTQAQAATDNGGITSPVPMYALLNSVRDGLLSRATYRVDFTVNAASVAPPAGPTPFLLDTFTASNGTLPTARDLDVSPVAGLRWTEASIGTSGPIQSNALAGTAASLWWSADPAVTLTGTVALLMDTFVSPTGVGGTADISLEPANGGAITLSTLNNGSDPAGVYTNSYGPFGSNVESFASYAVAGGTRVRCVLFVDGSNLRVIVNGTVGAVDTFSFLPSDIGLIRLSHAGNTITEVGVYTGLTLSQATALSVIP